MDPESIWVLLQLSERGLLEGPGRSAKEGPRRTDGSIDALAAAGLLDAGESEVSLTPSGLELARRLGDARRAQLFELAALWSPTQHPELETFLDTVAITSLQEPAQLGGRDLE